MSESATRKLRVELKQYKDLLFAIVREQGRVRVSRDMIETNKPGDNVECRMTDDEKHLILTFKGGLDS
jgi:hypothetical protein